MPRYVGLAAVAPLHRAFDPDDVTDFHAARLLILLAICGKGSRPSIDGRTKLAKLDFFIRYPQFLARAEQTLAQEGQQHNVFQDEDSNVEAPMIRYRYGPWDPRYRQFVAFLESRGLVYVTKGRPERVTLTAAGRSVAGKLAQLPAFAPLVERARAMVGNLSDMRSGEVRDFVYRILAQEVGALDLGEIIAQ